MNGDAERIDIKDLRFNLPKHVKNLNQELGRSSSNGAVVGNGMNNKESSSPVSKKVNQNVDNNRKSDVIKRETGKQFQLRKLDLDEMGNFTQNLRTSLQNDSQGIHAKSSINLKKQNEENRDYIQQFKNLRFKPQYYQQNKVDGSVSTGLSSSSLRFVMKDKDDKQSSKDHDSATSKQSQALQKDNIHQRKSDFIRHKRNLSNQNEEGHNKTSDHQADQNIKKFLAQKMNSKVADNEQGNLVRKCISSREIYIPNVSSNQQQHPPQGIAMLSQEILNPLKIQANQMSSFQSSRIQDNNKWFSPNNTPLKKVANDLDKSSNQVQQANLQKLYNSVQGAKSPRSKDNNSQFSSPQVNTAYKQYLNRIIQKQHQTYEKSNIIESPLSVNSPDNIIAQTLKGSQSLNLLNHQGSSRQTDHIQKKSVMQNIFLKDKDSVNIDEINFRQKKLEQSINNVELPPLMFPASKKELAEFQKLQEQNELRFSRANKNQIVDEEEHRGVAHHHNNMSEDRLKKHHNIGNLKISSDFFKQKQDSLRIMELVKERNESIRQQKMKQQENLIQQGQKQNVQFDNLIQESFQNRFFSNSPFKIQQKSKTRESQAIIITDVSEITKSHKIIQSSHNIPSQHQISPIRGSQKQIPSSSKLAKTLNNWQSNEASLTNTPSATFSNKFNFSKIRRQLTKGSPTLKSIGSNIIEEYEEQMQTSIIQKKQKDSHEKELAIETHLVDYLQQKKIFIRQSLEQFLKERPRIVKGIQRNCLMDPEQFVFFMMSFVQFCIDDMFEEFKRNYSIKLAQLAVGSSDKIHSPVLNSINETEAVSFKFGQKVPEDIMKQVVEVIINCLENQLQHLKMGTIEISSEENTDEGKHTKKQSLDLNLEDDEKTYIIDEGLDKFYKKIQKNVEKYIHPQTLIDRIGGFARLRQLIISGVKTFNNYINSASKMIYIEEDDEDLIDKYLMPGFCALVNEDKETLSMLISIFKQHKNYLSHYDFFTFKKIAWDTLSSIKLDSKLKNFVILKLENIRYEFFDNPFEKRVKELGSSLMKSYELCNYFRNPNPADNTTFLTSLIPVLYKNAPYATFYQANQQRLKFALNDRFFDHLQKFLLDELKETDTKSILDLQIRVTKLRIRAGVAFNFFSIINEDSETFFNQIFPFLSSWIQKYNLSQMDSKAQDFKFLELFLKWSLNKQDYYSIMDSEPCLMHYVVNEFMIQFWIKGIAAYFEDKQISKSQYQHVINFLSQYLLFKREENTQKQSQQIQIPLDLSPSKSKH